jgi:hypothetical protein
VAGVALGGTARPASATVAARQGSAGRSESARFSFENCPARTTILRATIAKRMFRYGEPVVMHIALSNVSAKPCGTPGPAVPMGPLPLTAGPCAVISVQVNTSKGVDLFPGPVAIPCPAPFPLFLHAHQTLTTTDQWAQTASLTSGSRVHASPGNYRLIIGGRITFRISILDVP